MPWAVYKNGNSTVKINLTDGTKIRETEADEFDLEFPESLDVACTNYCTGGCEFCYANCTTTGKHADIMNAKFIDTLHPYTEIALQLNDLSHPDLIPFLEKIKARRAISNITVNQMHFEQKESLICKLVERDLIKGIGISLRNPTPDFIKRVKKYPNAVIHVINCIVSEDDINAMAEHDLKLLILGYKYLGRGVEYASTHSGSILENGNYLYKILPKLPKMFKLVSFDNLAIEQLDVRRILTDDEWEEFYMGDEGTASMYVDLVNGKYGVSSLCKPEEMLPMTDSIEEMFAVIKQKARKMRAA